MHCRHFKRILPPLIIYHLKICTLNVSYPLRFVRRLCPFLFLSPFSKQLQSSISKRLLLHPLHCFPFLFPALSPCSHSHCTPRKFVFAHFLSFCLHSELYKTQMASLRFLLCFLVFWLSNSILIPTCCLGKVCLTTRNDAALFVFGDSLFDVGNNNYIGTALQPTFLPYGETFFKYPTGRFSDGRLFPDFIAEYAELPLMQPYLYPGYQQYIYGVNFASAGAGALVETHQGKVIDLKTQISYFKKVNKVLRQKLGNAGTKNLLARAVYLFYFGSNDYITLLFENSSPNASTISREKYVEMVVGNLTSAIKEIHKQGGRKFGFLNLAPIGCVPLFKRGEGCSREPASAVAKLHNTLLSVELQKLEKQLQGFKYSFMNFYDSLIEVINQPSKYGFKGSGTCLLSVSIANGTAKDFKFCENPNDYIFFDTVHPSEKANKYFSQLMWSGNQSIVGPYNLKTLFEA